MAPWFLTVLDTLIEAPGVMVVAVVDRAETIRSGPVMVTGELVHRVLLVSSLSGIVLGSSAFAQR